METEIKMLSDIHKNADMGQDTLRHILEEKGLQTDIEIDGGVDTKNLRRCRNMKKHFRSVDKC